MAWFKRKGASDDTVEADVADAVVEPVDEAADDDTSSEEPVDRGTADAELAAAGRRRRLEDQRAESGPLDEAEADAEVARIDLGSLRLPATDKLELRLEVQDQTKRVLSVTVAKDGSALQMQAFAAPRTAGVWDDIRTEISAQVVKQGGAVEEVDGPFGLELVARVPVRTEDGRTGHRPSRFVGVDGPRWFLRGVLTGLAAHDTAAAAPLEDVFRGVVVVRGTDARPPRELLPLQLPPGAQPPGAAPAEAAPPAEPGVRPTTAPPERGPEMTETR